MLSFGILFELLHKNSFLRQNLIANNEYLYVSYYHKEEKRKITLGICVCIVRFSIKFILSRWKIFHGFVFLFPRMFLMYKDLWKLYFTVTGEVLIFTIS